MVTRTRITKLMAMVAQLSLLAALTSTPPVSAEHAAQRDRTVPRRLIELPFDIEIPGVNDFFDGIDAGTPCEYLELFFSAQIIADGLGCQCTESSENPPAVTLSCELDDYATMTQAWKPFATLTPSQQPFHEIYCWTIRQMRESSPLSLVLTTVLWATLISPIS